MDECRTILITVLLITFLSACNALVFKPKPKSQDAIDGRWATLQCGVEGSDADSYTISWLIAGKKVVDNSRRFQEQNNLYFRPINKHLDSNEFQCQATERSTGRKYKSDPVQFRIKWLQVENVELRRPSNPAMIVPDVEGGIVLACNMFGNPKPNNLSWYVNDAHIRNGDPPYQMRGGELMIDRPAMRAHDGNYTCCASHPLASPPSRYECTPNGGAFHLQVLDVRTPRLIRSPESQVVVKGANVMLHCVFEADPPPVIVWRRRGIAKEITNYSRSGMCKRKCVYSNGSLALINVKESSEGVYLCSARQDGQETQPASASVTLAYIKDFKKPSIEKFVRIGDMLEFHCEVPPSLPRASIVWKRIRDNRVIANSNGHIASMKNTLVIDNIKESDLGHYACVANNIAGSVARNVSIQLAVAPHFGQLANQQADEGANVTLVCPVTGKPFPKVTWLQDGVAVGNLPGKRNLNNETLTLINANISDQGVYQCVATSGISLPDSTSQSNQAQLQIFERLKFWPVLTDMCIARGEKRQVICKVKGNESPHIRWYRLNGSAESNAPQIASSFGRSQSLIFNNPNRSASGLYRCTATTTALTINMMIRVEVVDRPKIVVPPRNITVFEGKPVMLDCKTIADQQFKVVWKFHGRTYNADQGNSVGGHFVILRNGSLLIPHVRLNDVGFYTCSYTNCDLKASSTAELTVVRDDPHTNPPETPLTPSNQMIQTVALSVSGGIAYVLVTVALIIYCRSKRRKRRKSKTGLGEEEKMLNASHNGQSRGNHGDEIIKVTNAIPMEDLSCLDPDINSLLFPLENLKQVTYIGKGEFGDVFLSKAPRLLPENQKDGLVMVKTLDLLARGSNDKRFSLSRATGTRSEFNRDINLLRRANHVNVVKLLGVSVSRSKPDHIITEYLEMGILKSCLLASKEEKIPKLEKTHMMNLCFQISRGVHHLNKLGLVHKDVATRNCVVNSQLLVKLSILSLTRKGFENEYCQHEGKVLPARWMAPEALFEGDFSSKSDVWSFGVACWEIFTLGEMPYKEMTDVEFIIACRSDDRPPFLKPLDGVKKITSLIRKCCQRFPSERPEIRQIMRKLQSILTAGDAPKNGKLKTIVDVAKAMDEGQTTEDTEEG